MIGMAIWLALSAPASVPVMDPAVTPTKSLATGRAAAPLDDTCDEPVLLIATGPGRDPARMVAYAKAVQASGLYQRLGGYELAGSHPLDVLEGNPANGFVTSVVRFPCRANALAFWNSATYQAQLKGLRSNPAASDLVVAIYPEPALRADLVGKVDDNSYTAAFDAATVPQVARPKP